MALQQLHHFLFKKEALLLHSLAHLHTPQAHHGTAAAALCGQEGGQQVQWGTIGGLEHKQHLCTCSSSRGYGTLVMYHWLCIGLARTVHIYTVYDRIFGDSPAKNTAYKPYLYGSGQP